MPNNSETIPGNKQQLQEAAAIVRRLNEASDAYYNGKGEPCYFGAAYEFLTDDHTCEGTIGLAAASEVEFEDDGHAIAWAMQQ